MKTKYFSTAFLFILLGFWTSCSEDDQPAKPAPNGDALHTLLNDNRDELKQTFTLNADAGGSVKGANGTILQFSGGGFLTLADGAVTGEVTIEFIEIYDRSSMLLSNMPTMGRTFEDEMAMLVSGGQFFINAKKGDTPLKPSKAFKIIAPTSKTGVADFDMGIFKGEEECEGDTCNVIWEEEDRGLEIVEWQDVGGVYSAYFVIQSQFGWTNIDRWYNDPRPKTTIYVDVPEGFDNTNCAVFIMYEDEPAALGRMDVYDAEKAMFTEHYGLVPIGLKVHFVLVSIIDDQIHYAIQSSTIVENHVEIISSVETITEEELIELIDDLP